MSEPVIPTQPGRTDPPADRPAPARFTTEKAAAPLERTARIAFWIYWVAWMGTLGYVWTHDPGLTHGDSFSDANVLNASRNFDQFGLGLYYGLPVHQATHSPEHPAPPYTHYPAGPEWIHEVLKAAGLRELWQFRAASVGVAAIALLLAKAAFTRLSGSHLLGTLGVFFYSWSAPFSQYADSLHEHAYVQLTLFGVIASWLAFERASSPARRRVWLGLAAIGLFADLWLSFGHILFIPVFAGLRMLCVGRRRDFAGAAIIVLMPVLVMALRLAHNSLALGSLKAGFNDLATIAQYRAALDEQPDTLGRSFRTWRARLGGEGKLADGSDKYFVYPLLRPAVRNTVPLLAVVLLCVWPLAAVASVRRAFANALLLLVAGMAWFLVMKNHAMIHRHLVMLLVPGLALLLASLVAGGLLQWWCMPRRAPLRWIGPGIALVLLGGFAWQMRKSLVVNHLVSLNEQARAEIQHRADAAQVLAHAGAGALRETQRVFIMGSYPEIACQLARPYELVLLGPAPELTRGQALWVEYWSDADKALARHCVHQYGLPDMLSAPQSVSMIFRPDATPGRPVDIRFEGGARLTRLRCVPTLDGQSWLIQSCFSVPQAASTPTDDLIQFTHVIDAQGQDVANADVRFSWGLQDDQTIILWRTVPRSSVPIGARLRVGLWSTSQGRALTPVFDAAVLSRGVTPDPEHAAFVWDAFTTPAEETP